MYVTLHVTAVESRKENLDPSQHFQRNWLANAFTGTAFISASLTVSGNCFLIARVVTVAG